MPKASSKKRGLARRYAAYLSNSKARPAGRVAAGLAGLAAVGVLVLVIALTVLAFLTPSRAALESAKVQRPSVIKAADGTVLTEFRRLNRRWASLSEIDTTVVRALVATEDHRFYDHPGIDAWRLAGAMGRTLLGNRQGGSTLTMQLARNLYPDEIGRAATLLRKLKEAVTAFKIEAVYSKDEIVETYLNTVPFLYNAHGIEAAAQTYFGTSASNLHPREAATLVGMLKATAHYNPVRHPERAQQRRNVVLRQMVKRGSLSAAYYEKLKDDPLGLRFEPQRYRRPSAAPHFTAHVRGQLQDWAEERGYDLYASGLVVHTTLDPALQRMAEAAARRQGQALQAVADAEWGRASGALLARSTKPYERAGVTPFGEFWTAERELANAFIRATPRYRHSLAAGVSAEETLRRLRADGAFRDSLRAAKMRLETGLVAMDPADGRVRAWVGSRDFQQGQYDHVASARRQPGSTFKPFLYAAALDAGIRPSDTYRDAPVEIATEGDRVWRPVNASGEASGEMLTVREGLEQSKNTIAAQLMQEVGARRTARMAQRLGVRESALREVPSLALGTSSVTLLEMTTAYATIANGGVYHAPLLITRIESRDGAVLASYEPEGERALDEETAAALLDMMRGVIDRGTGRAIRNAWGVRADVAGKTGTTQGGADGWFLMMHPQLVSGAWVGFNDPRVTFRSDYWGQGAHNALRVVGDFYQQALRRGALSPEPTLAPPPEAPPQGPSALDRAGTWIASAADWVGGQIQSAGAAIAGAVGGWLEDGETEPPRSESEPRVASEEASDEAPPEAFEEETTEERRARLERYWREVQEERRRRLERALNEARSGAAQDAEEGAGQTQDELRRRLDELRREREAQRQPSPRDTTTRIGW